MQEDAQVWYLQAGTKIQREDRGDTKAHTPVLFPKTMLGNRNADIESLLQDTGYGGRIVTI